MVTSTQFLEYVEKSGLIDDFELAVVLNAASAQLPKNASDGVRTQRLMEELIGRGLLTRWQCSKLLEGRHKGFYLGRYRLMDFLGSTRSGSRYAAKNEALEPVELLVAPGGSRTYFVVMKPDSFIEDDVVSA